MRFVISDGRRFKNEVEDFPFKNLFQNSKILAVCVENSDVVGACGIDQFNYAGVYVKEQFRSRGIGGRILKNAITTAEKNGCSFIICDVSSDNAPSLHIFSKLGFKEIAYFKRSKNIFMMLTLDMKSKFLFTGLRLVCHLLPNSVLERVRSDGSIRTLLTMIS